MAEEEKSAGSGFGKLVYGTLKGNGINTDDLSFDEAVKKFNELGGTDNWHAKIMRKEAEENKEKEARNQSAKDEIKNLREQIKAMDVNDPKRVPLLKKVHFMEDQEKAKQIMAEAKEKFPVGSQIHDMNRREWFTIKKYNEDAGSVWLEGDTGATRTMKAEQLQDFYDRSPLNKKDSSVNEKNDTSKNETLQKIEKFGWGHDSVNSPEGKILLTNGANGEAALLFDSWEDAKKWSENPTYKGMSLQPGEDQKPQTKGTKPEIKQKVAEWDDRMKYAMLDRMQQDAKYYLGFGERADKHLWAGNPEDHIQYMEEIYSQLKTKPDWISEKDINNYKSQMLASGKPEKESTKQKVEKNTKEFMDKAKKGEIKPEGNAPKEFKWNGKTNSYEYGGASVMESMIAKGLYEVDVAGEELIVSSLEEAKKKIDQMNAYEKKHNGYMYGQDKYI